jgi:hypothetical protein
MSKEAYFMVAELNKWFGILESTQTLQICQGQCMTAPTDHQRALKIITVEACV